MTNSDSNTYRSSQAPADGLVEALRDDERALSRFHLPGTQVNFSAIQKHLAAAADAILILRSRCDGVKEALEEACELIQDMIKYKYRIDDGRAFLAKAREGKK